jgi:hypothetical protein
LCHFANLINEGLCGLPNLVFKVSDSAPVNPILDYSFPLTVNSLASLRGPLLLGAVNPAFSHDEGGSSRILVQRGRTISEINKAVQDQKQALRDDTIYAVTCVIVSENRIGNEAACRIHLDGLMEMVRLQGGLESFNKNKAICRAWRGWRSVFLQFQHWPKVSIVTQCLQRATMEATEKRLHTRMIFSVAS